MPLGLAEHLDTLTVGRIETCALDVSHGRRWRAATVFGAPDTVSIVVPMAVEMVTPFDRVSTPPLPLSGQAGRR